MYDLEYADDTLLFGIRPDVVEEYCPLRSESFLYGEPLVPLIYRQHGSESEFSSKVLE